MMKLRCNFTAKFIFNIQIHKTMYFLRNNVDEFLVL